MRQASESILELDQTEIGFEEPTPVPMQTVAEKPVLLTKPPKPTVPGAIVGILTGFEETGTPLVAFTEHAEGCPLPARSTVELLVRQIGCEVVLIFEQGDLTKPIILGCICPQSPAERDGRLEEARLDGEHVVLSAEREIVLRCGKSSITLTRAGKVIVRGAYLLSRSSGVNRIKGGSVQIN
jgi:hypothetical protein